MPWWDPQTWDWATLIKTVIGAGVGTALVQAGLAIYRDRRQRNLRAAYMAKRLAVTLESYAMACSYPIAENANAQTAPDEQYPDWKVSLPELLYHEDPDGWQAIDPKLHERCLPLSTMIGKSEAVISATIEHDMDELGDILDEKAARCGLEAWNLGVALRHKHVVAVWRKLAVTLRGEHSVKGGLNTEWDYAGHLESTPRKLEKARKERLKQNTSALCSLLVDGS
jgi:hypothetical protein